MSELGKRLRVLRAKRCLSLREAARRAGIVKETISDIERGHTHPYDVTLAKLAKAYDVPVEELLEERTVLTPGEPYAEEVLDPELHEFNRLTKELSDAVLEDRWALQEWLNRPEAECGDEFSERMEAAYLNLERLIQEYESFLFRCKPDKSGQQPDTIGPGQ